MNFSNIPDLVICFYLGVLVGWWFNRKPPVIKGAKIECTLRVDEKVLDQIKQAEVMAWLESRGLTWQPKGAVFDPHRDVKK